MKEHPGWVRCSLGHPAERGLLPQANLRVGTRGKLCRGRAGHSMAPVLAPHQNHRDGSFHKYTPCPLRENPRGGPPARHSGLRSRVTSLVQPSSPPGPAPLLSSGEERGETLGRPSVRPFIPSCIVYSFSKGPSGPCRVPGPVLGTGYGNVRRACLQGAPFLAAVS